MDPYCCFAIETTDFLNLTKIISTLFFYSKGQWKVLIMSYATNVYTWFVDMNKNFKLEFPPLQQKLPFHYV